MRRGRAYATIAAKNLRPSLPLLAGAVMVQRMLRNGFLVALAALALGVGGCSVDPRGSASKAIASFLAAVQRRDGAAMEVVLDRPALRIDLRDQLAALGRSNGIDVGGGPSEFAMDRMITAQAIRRAQAHTTLPAVPTAAQVAPLLKVKDKDHVCVQDAVGAACALSFARRRGTWRLTGMAATGVKVP